MTVVRKKNMEAIMFFEKIASLKKLRTLVFLPKISEKQEKVKLAYK